MGSSQEEEAPRGRANGQDIKFSDTKPLRAGTSRKRSHIPEVSVAKQQWRRLLGLGKAFESLGNS